MQIIFDFINQGWVGSIIGIIGIILAIIFYKKSQVDAMLACNLTSSRVISKSESTPDEIKISYKGEDVNRIVKTNVTLWNSGNKTIFGSNIVSNDPLRIEVNPDEKIIGFNILKHTKVSNDFKVTKFEQNNVKVNFDFMDANDGVVIEILHTDQKIYPHVKGTIIGLPKGAVVEKSLELKKVFFRSSKFTKVVHYFMIFSGILAISVFLLSRVPELRKGMDESLIVGSPEFIYWSFFIAGILYTVFPISILLQSRKKFPKNLTI